MGIQRIDCVGEVCPKPLITTLNNLKKLSSGDVLVVETDNSVSAENILNWAKKKGYPARAEEVASGEWEVYIEKK